MKQGPFQEYIQAWVLGTVKEHTGRFAYGRQKERIEKAFREILIAIGEDPDREGLVETPKRVANMYEEIFSGLYENPEKHLKMFRE